jgi:putative transcriptional regulator
MITLCGAISIVATVAGCGGAAFAAEMSASGIFLVATDELRDPNFRKTVVLVTQPRRGGPFGVIINRPLNHRLSEIFPEIEALKNKQDVVYSGGPVARQGLVFVVRASKPPLRATHVLRDVYITADPGEVDELLKRSNPTRGLRVYAGHSGWAPGQLQNEITSGGWHVLPADAETVFEKDPATIWPELSRRAALRKARVHTIRPAPVSAAN